MWKNFKGRLIDEDYQGDMSEHKLTHLFEVKLQEEINEEISIYKCGERVDEPSLQVSNISFARKNAKIMKLLRNRGRCMN